MANRLSDNMLRVLRLARDGKDLYSGVSGLAQHGGHSITIAALHRRGLLYNMTITDEGLAAIDTARTVSRGDA